MIKKLCEIKESELFLVPFAEISKLSAFFGPEADFDCFLVNRLESFSCADSTFIDILGGLEADWIEVFGHQSEQIHDAIDLASVKANRQKSVGDGVPMTSWNDNERDDAIAERIMCGGLGVSVRKVLIVIGSECDEINLVRAISTAMKDVTEIDF